jgi:hypothetical protein
MRTTAWWGALLLLLVHAGADARPVPCKSDSEHLAAGGIIFTGQVVALGPARQQSREWVEFSIQNDPSGRLARTERVLIPDAGLYTMQFALGWTYTVWAFRTADGLATRTCMQAPQR